MRGVVFCFLPILCLFLFFSFSYSWTYKNGSLDIDYYVKIYTNRITGNHERSYLEPGFQGYNELTVKWEHSFTNSTGLEGYFEGIQTSDENENEKEFALRNFYLSFSIFLNPPNISINHDRGLLKCLKKL